MQWKPGLDRKDITCMLLSWGQAIQVTGRRRRMGTQVKLNILFFPPTPFPNFSLLLLGDDHWQILGQKLKWNFGFPAETLSCWNCCWNSGSLAALISTGARSGDRLFYPCLGRSWCHKCIAIKQNFHQSTKQTNIQSTKQNCHQWCTRIKQQRNMLFLSIHARATKQYCCH